MSEDSKKLANTGAHGIKLTFHAIDPIPTDQFVSMMEGLLRSVGDKVNQRGRDLIGHAKSFITTPAGTLKVNLIDTDLGPESLSRLTSDEVEEGEMKFMCVLMGLSDHEVGEIMVESLAELNGRMEIHVEQHEHGDHNHKHDEHQKHEEHDHEEHDHEQEERK